MLGRHPIAGLALPVLGEVRVVHEGPVDAPLRHGVHAVLHEPAGGLVAVRGAPGVRVAQPEQLWAREDVRETISIRCQRYH